MGNKKVIVVGHPSCQIEDIKNVLIKCGMYAAQPSRREKLSAQEITQLICHAHTFTPIEKLQKVEDFAFINVEPMWQELALDLLLGNVGNHVWGWADAGILPLLKYWKGLDSSIAFVLVYDAPENCLKNIFDSVLDQDELELSIQEKLNNWYVYNKKLLDFYLEYSDRCVLVHAQQVKQSTQSYIQQIEKHVGILLDGEMPFAQVDENNSHSKIDYALVSDVSIYDTFDRLQSYTFNELLENYIEVKNLYNEMQSVSNLPIVNDSHKVSASQAVNILHTLKIDQKKNNDKIQALLKDIRNISHEKESMINDLQAKLNIVAKERAELAAKADWRRRHIDEINQDKDEQAKLLKASKLELEQIRKERADFAAKADWRRRHIEEINKNKDEQSKLLKVIQLELNKVKKEKDEIKGKSDWRFKRISEITEIQKGQEKVIEKYKEKFDKLSKEYIEQRNIMQVAVQEKEILIKQLMKLQAEAEKYLLPKTINQAKPLYGAADRIKEQLPYRLGSVLLNQSKTIKGVLTLPLVLSAEKKRYLQEQQKEMNQNLPPIDEYVDIQEAERVKRHLSYRLGHVLVDVGEHPGNLVKLPWKFYSEFIAFKKGK